MKIFHCLAVSASANLFDDVMKNYETRLERKRRQVEEPPRDFPSCEEGEVMYDGICFENTNENINTLLEIQEADPEKNSLTRAISQHQKWTMVLARLLFGRDGHDGVRINIDQVSRRMFNYGCHCWPDYPENKKLTGKGHPMDKLDEGCKHLRDCHMCLRNEFGESEQCDSVHTQYWARLKDGKVFCKDPQGTCKRSLCECDKVFAINFANHWDQWNEENDNLKQAGTYDSICHRSGPRAIVSADSSADSAALFSDDGSNGGSNAKVQTFDASASSASSSSLKTQCCGSYSTKIIPYNPDKHMCMDDNKLVLLSLL